MRIWPTGGLWRHRDFLHLWGAQIISAFGSRITRTALPALAILTLGASDGEVAFLGALALLPAVVMGLAASTFIDRVRRRPLMIGCDIVGALALLSIPLAAWAGMLDMLQIYVVAIISGSTAILFALADQTLLPDLVGREHLEEGNAKLATTDSVAEIGGPALAGVLIEILTAPFAILADALSLLWSALLLGRIRAVETPHQETGDTGLAAALAGLKSVWRSPILSALFGAEAIMMFSFGFFAALYMLFALRVLGMDIGFVGLIISVGGIGALLGAVAGPPLVRRIGLGPAIVLFFTLTIGSSLLIPAATGDDWLSVAFLVTAQLVGDAAAVAYFIQTTTLRQTVTPQAVLGRVNAALLTMHGLVLMVGALIAAPLAEAIGIRATVWTGISLGFIGLLPLLLSPVSRLRSLGELQPSAPATLPSAG
ncbi:MAG: MFS transporter [Micropepsaceae bacterium]